MPLQLSCKKEFVYLHHITKIVCINDEIFNSHIHRLHYAARNSSLPL